MMASVFLSRVIGVFREMAMANIGGASGEVDAYLVAFMIPDILNHIVASGFLSMIFIPIFTRYLTEKEEDKGWEAFSVIMSCFGGIVLVLIIIAIIFTPEIISVVAPGLKEPEYRKIAIKMTRIIMPAQFFFFAGGLLMAVQFSKEKFFIPALAPLLYNLGIIGGGLLLGPRWGMEGFSWGVLAGAFIGNFVVQYYGARMVGMKFKWLFVFKHPDFKNFFLLALPFMIGLPMMFSTEIFFKFFGSYMSRGSISCLNYSYRIMLMLAGFFGQAIGMAMYPFISRMIAEKNLPEANKLLNNILRIIAIVIPISILLMVLRHEIILTLYQHGSFDTAATDLTAQTLFYFLIGAFAFSAQTVVVRGYYAMQDTLFPAIFLTIVVLLSIPIYYFAMRIMGTKGIALAVSLSVIIQVILLYGLWSRKSKNRESRKVFFFYIKILIISLTIGIFLEWFKTAMLHGIDITTRTGSLLVSVITGTVFVVLLVSAGTIFKIDEINELIKRIVDKFKMKNEKS